MITSNFFRVIFSFQYFDYFYIFLPYIDEMHHVRTKDEPNSPPILEDSAKIKDVL